MMPVLTNDDDDDDDGEGCLCVLFFNTFTVFYR